ncbi:MAG: zinc metallopeptidase [Verrucomicrobia bacterium]|nr:zinc metallopeptidase [Verrucomicrobiota bacterium]
MMFGLFFGPWDWLMIPGLLLGAWAQMKLMSTYRRYAQQPVETGLSGAEAAREILDRAGLRNMPVNMVPGHLTDHYDPTKRALFLSEENYHGRSIAAVGVAAHEAGHALQHKAAYAPLQWRMMMVPATNVCSKAVWLILFGGMILMMLRIITPALFGMLLPYAIGAFAVVTLFQLITLPVEYDASRRAKQELSAIGIVRGHETGAVSRVLNAAALTYVAALVTSMLELLRLVLIARSFGSSDDS